MKPKRKMKTYVWINSGGTRLFKAQNMSKAYDKIIKHRMKSGQTREAAIAWFDQDDQIHEVRPL